MLFDMLAGQLRGTYRSP